MPHEAIAELADVLGSYFDPEMAQERLDFLAGSPLPAWDPGDHVLNLARAENLTRLGDYEAAAVFLDKTGLNALTLDIAYRSRRAAACAALAALRGDPEAPRLAEAAVVEARQQRAELYETKASLVRALASEDAPALSRQVLLVAELQPASLVVFAQIPASRPSALDPGAIAWLSSQVSACPKRWIQPLRTTVRTGNTQGFPTAARLLEPIGI